MCMVDTGAGEPVQVVCGAPNARGGLIGVFSPPGTYIPGKNITLGVGTIRGVESRGMLCSGAELGISDDHDGIIELPADAPVGQPYAAWAGLDDLVIEINLHAEPAGLHRRARHRPRPRRGRTWASSRTPAPNRSPAMFPCPVNVKLDFGETPPLCPGSALRLGARREERPVTGVAAEAAEGHRPAADQCAGRYHQLHHLRPRPSAACVRCDKVTGNLVVRRAKAGETLLALDGKTYTLDETMCVIADDKGKESLAGIMGGEDSGCDENTTDVLIESALWVPINIAATGRKLGTNPDARYRFERGIDPAS